MYVLYIPWQISKLQQEHRLP